LLRALHLFKSYGPLEVVKDVSLEISKGEVVSIVGASGAGKSTLLHLISTLDSPDQGQVFFENKELTKLKSNALASFRNKHMGFVFQFHNLLAEFTALENVCLPAYLAGRSEKEAQTNATVLLERLGLADRMDHKPSELSGGEQQRTAVARALINSPAIVFADEPSGNLDSRNALDLHKLFFELRDEIGQTFVLVTHNEQLANMADRKLTMLDGRLEV
jgi:lipoprotein-releasing system ATP-binding protein